MNGKILYVLRVREPMACLSVSQRLHSRHFRQNRFSCGVLSFAFQTVSVTPSQMPAALPQSLLQPQRHPRVCKRPWEEDFRTLGSKIKQVYSNVLRTAPARQTHSLNVLLNRKECPLFIQSSFETCHFNWVQRRYCPSLKCSAEHMEKWWESSVRLE